MPSSTPKTIAEYIEAAPTEARLHLLTLHAILKKAAPKAAEAIKWGMPVFGPTPSVMEAFAKDLADWKSGKGRVQFPYDRPLPKALIRKMALLRVKELKEKDAKWM